MKNIKITFLSLASFGLLSLGCYIVIRNNIEIKNPENIFQCNIEENLLLYVDKSSEKYTKNIIKNIFNQKKNIDVDCFRMALGIFSLNSYEGFDEKEFISQLLKSHAFTTSSHKYQEQVRNSLGKSFIYFCENMHGYPNYTKPIEQDIIK